MRSAGTKVRSDATQSDFSDSDAYGDLNDGLQTRYTINYTTGLLTPISNSDYYSFVIDNGASPDLVGQAYDSADVVMKYISEADLMNYGAVLVEEDLSEGDQPTPIGEREFKWVLDDPDHTDKFGEQVSNPLLI